MPQSFRTDQTCIINKTKKSPILLTNAEGQKCPPASPISPLLNNTFYYDQYFHDFATSSSSPKAKEKNKKTKKPTTKRVRSRSKSFRLRDEFPACSYNGLFSSDEDDEEEDDDKTTLFSSRSLSSDSSESLRRSKSCKSTTIKKTNPKNNHRRKRGVKDDSEIMGRSMAARLMEGKVKDSFAVVKRSSDPYNDFRTSMVEMIVERQIFSAQDLENLLQCFLSLNSYQHHRVIVEVFTEIWEALFSNWSQKS